MLTPGIEYVGVATDEEAIAFADGDAKETPPIFWTEVGTLLPVAVLGALLTARPIADLASEPELATLSVEEREGSEIHLLRLPRVLVDALIVATEEALGDVARRARVYVEFRDTSAEDIEVFLTHLVSIARRGGGLYARVIVSTDTAPRTLDLRTKAALVLPWIGLAVAALSLLAAFWIGRSAPFVYFPALVTAAVLANLSAGALFARRRRRHIEELVDTMPGSVAVTVDADDRFTGLLPILLLEVLGTHWGGGSFARGRVYLSAQPAGMELHHDGRSVLFPSAQVLGITTTTVPSLRTDFGSDGRVAALAIVLRVNDEESAIWEVAVLADDGGRPTLSQLEPVAAAMAAIVGARV